MAHWLLEVSLAACALVLRVVVLGAAMLGAMAAMPRLSAPLVALVELGGDRWRARGRRSALARMSASHK